MVPWREKYSDKAWAVSPCRSYPFPSVAGEGLADAHQSKGFESVEIEKEESNEEEEKRTFLPVVNPIASRIDESPIFPAHEPVEALSLLLV